MTHELENETFENESFRGEVLHECRLLGVDFAAATLTSVQLERCDLSYALLRGHDLSGIDLREVKATRPTRS